MVSLKTLRVVFIVWIVVQMGVLSVSALTFDSVESKTLAEPTGDVSSAKNITFVTTQGTETGFGGGVYAINPSTNEVVWSYTDPLFVFDVHVIDKDTILVPANVGETRNANWSALIVDWREGEVKDSFPIPVNTHDVEYIGDGEYAVAEKGYGPPRKKTGYDRWVQRNERNNWTGDYNTTMHRIYVYNATQDEIVWQYNFRDDYPTSIGGDYPKWWSHVNDVDAVNNGSDFLVSPRNFNEVILLNRSTKDITWRLGNPNSTDTLNKQHNPMLLSSDPTTVLVADSHNDRAVEYRRNGSNWTEMWAYHGDLNWPRDADRLPNGNTLIVDSDGDRVIEVTPEKEIVWEINVRDLGLGQKPYDVERVRYGEEPGGPTMNKTESGLVDRENTVFAPILDAIEYYYAMASWVLPIWVGPFEFGVLNTSVLSLFAWGGIEIRSRYGRLFSN